MRSTKHRINCPYVESLGIELEGGIDEGGLVQVYDWIRNNDLGRYFSNGQDCSVELDGFDYNDMELRFWNKELDKILDFANKVYSSGLETNETCGLHVHIKFRDDILGATTFRRFYTLFMEAYLTHFKDSGKYIERAKNGYCRDVYWAEKQLREREEGLRYSAINFVSLKEAQNTVEFRIFPNQESFRELANTLRWLLRVLNKIFDKDFERGLIQDRRFNLALSDRYPLIKEWTINLQLRKKRFEIDVKPLEVKI